MIYEKPYMIIILLEKEQSDIITTSYTPGGTLEDIEGGTGEGTPIW